MKAIIIIDHGSRYPTANETLLKVVDLFKSKCPNLIIEPAHMELAEPTIEQAYRKCIELGATHIIAHPYMLSPGRHAIRDIPNMVMDIAQEFPDVSYDVTEPLGIHEKIIEVIMDRCKV